MANASRGCPRKVRQVSGPEPTVGRQRGQIAQLLGGLQRSWAAQSWAEKLGSPKKSWAKVGRTPRLGELGACDHGRDHAALAVGKQAKSRTARGNG